MESILDYGKNGRRSLRYSRSITLERDSPRTIVTFRDVKISQWESRRPDRRWV